MPYSLVLNLTPVSPISPGYLSGRHLHALFLTLVTSVDRDLGNYLHDSRTEKAFTLSNLQLSQPKRDRILRVEYQKSIPPGTPCWWRITLLDDNIFSQLSHLWLNLNPDRPWHLGSADLKISSILGTPQPSQPWANACPYLQLYEQSSDRDRILSLALATPTAFRKGKYDTSLPTAESVFNSIRSRWNKYSGIEIGELPFDCIFPNFFNIRTEITADIKSKFIGCVGEISYRIFGDVDPVQIKQLNALANYALYCGIGRKTTMGMGMARRL